MVIDEDYPELLAILAHAGKLAFESVAGKASDELGFALAEYVRGRLGGINYRLLVWREEEGENGVGPAPLEHPRQEPTVVFTTECGQNVDLIAFIHATARWLLGQRLPGCDPADAHAAATDLARRFHSWADGRDQTYIPKGEAYEKKAMYRRIWAGFNGRNFGDLARAEGVSEVRVRQIIAKMRRTRECQA